MQPPAFSRLIKVACSKTALPCQSAARAMNSTTSMAAANAISSGERKSAGMLSKPVMRDSNKMMCANARLRDFAGLWKHSS